MLEIEELSFQDIKKSVREAIATKLAGIRMIIEGNLMMVPDLEHAASELADYVEDSFQWRPEYVDLYVNGYVVKLDLDLHTSLGNPILSLERSGESIEYTNYYYEQELVIPDFLNSFKAEHVEVAETYYVHFTRNADSSYDCLFNAIAGGRKFEKCQTTIHPKDSSSELRTQALMMLLATHEVLEELKNETTTL